METRPLLQGARLTAWELDRMGAPHRLLVDSAGPFMLARGQADVVLTGADRVAANGDTANKIGTFSLALGARHAGVPFIVVAPESTVDADTPDGAGIDIEDRGTDEVVSLAGVSTAPDGTRCRQPRLRPCTATWPAYEVRVQGGGMNHRLLCLLVRDAEDRPSIVCLGGLSKPRREKADPRDYRRITGYRKEFERHRRVLTDADFLEGLGRQLQFQCSGQGHDRRERRIGALG